MDIEFSADEIRRSIQRLYDMLDCVSPVNFNCGCLCGEICCVYDDSDYDEKVGLFLLPGEELMYEDSDCFEIFVVDSRDLDYPHTWDGDVFLVECVNPPHCERSIRPIQCRTFPLIPHLSDDGIFHLILDKHEMPYKCPLIEESVKLNDDFVRVTFNVWNILMKNSLVYDLVAFDSRRRDNRRQGYTVII